MNGAAEIPVLVAPALSVTDWVAEIRRFFAQRTVDTLELARLLSTARRTLRYGQWTELWRLGQLPLSRSRGNKLVAIGRTLGDLDGATLHHLPNGWSILYQLTRLDRATLLRLIAEGKIRPGLTFGQAKALVAEYVKVGFRKPRVLHRLRKVAEFVSNTRNEWSWEEVEEGQTIVTEMLRMIVGLQSHSHTGTSAHLQPVLDVVPVLRCL